MLNTIAVLLIGALFGVVITLGAVLWLDDQHMRHGRES